MMSSVEEAMMFGVFGNGRQDKVWICISYKSCWVVIDMKGEVIRHER